MKRHSRPLLTALALLSGVGLASLRLRPQNPEALGYEPRTMQGFRLYLSPELQDRPDLIGRLEWRLDEQLALVRRTLPEAQVRLLQANTPVYLELWPDWERSGNDMRVGNEYLAYYRGRFRPWDSLQLAWEALRDGLPLSTGGVLVPHPEALIDSHTAQPSLMLHEFAHAFDDLKFSFQNPAIQAAYNNAHTARLYRDDLNGDQYADRNAHEYFASLSEVYLGVNSSMQAPNTPAALKAHDPAGYAAIAAAWGVDAQGSAQP